MEKQLVWQEKKIYYFIEGHGPVVVLLHGLLENYHVWDDLIKFFKPKFKIVAIDLPGFGKSAVFGDVHSMSFMAQVVKAVLAAENISKAVVIGHSMGGYVSLAFAQLFSEALSGLILFHSQAADDSPEVKRNRLRTIEIVKKDHKDYISKFIPHLFAEENITHFSKKIENLKKQAYQTSAEGIIAALAGMAERNDSKDLLKNLDVPVFFVVGKKDPIISLPIIIEQMSLPKDAEAILLDGVGHMGFIEAPEKIFPILEGFCEMAASPSL